MEFFKSLAAFLKLRNFANAAFIILWKSVAIIPMDGILGEDIRLIDHATLIAGKMAKYVNRFIDRSDTFEVHAKYISLVSFANSSYKQILIQYLTNKIF